MRAYPVQISLAVAFVLTAQADEPAAQEGRLLSSTRQVTFARKRAGEGYFSADGSKMIFQSERE